ncbi:hypothetical protein Q7C36_004018 [Tachysurus vachellii]|uniref:Uncharacterized protein n=1 Tax=Tachysurus vachellii TaxID=175792 RepID=A0AA88NWK8_TACVA|nr:hypothetical protein Q7C36_004018 [Tachysurus vachellii]
MPQQKTCVLKGPICEDTFKLHSVELELEAVKKQIRDLQVKQAMLRERKAMLEASRRPLTVSGKTRQTGG